AHRLGYLHDFDQARELALTWIRSSGPLGNVAACSDNYLVALDYVAPVFPDMVLLAIKQASVEPGFASRENKNFNRFVSLLCHLAYEDESFNCAVEILLKFAETEKDGENNNSIVGQMRQLFSLHLSGTEATPERRQVFLQKLLTSGSTRHQEIAGQLFHSAFETHQWTSFGTFHFGARRRGTGWSPSTHDESIAWYLGYIRLLLPILNSTQQKDRDWAKTLLASHFRGLWSSAECFDALEQIILDYGRNGEWPEMWRSIKQTIHFDRDLHTPELIARLELLETLTSPSDLYSEIQAYVLVDTWDHIELRGTNYQESTAKMYGKVVKLGTLAASRPEYLERLGAKLWEMRVQPIWWFGEGLAIGSMDCLSMFNLLVALFQRHRSDSAFPNLLTGYVQGVYQQDASQARQLVEHALDISELKPYAIALLTTVPVVPWVSEKLLELAHEGELEAWRFEQISYGRAHEAIPDSELAALLVEINALNKGYLSSIQILSMRFFEKELRNYTPSEELCATGRAAIRQFVSAHRDDLRRTQLHGVERVLGEVFSPSTPQSDAKEIIESLCEGIKTYRLFASDISEITTAMITRYPELFLDSMLNDHYEAGTRILRERMGKKSPSLNDASVDRILAWCDGDQQRIAKVAKMIDVYSTNSRENVSDHNPKSMVLSEHAKSLLKEADDKLYIVQTFYEDIWPSNWSGSLADIIDARSKALAELLNYPDPAVKAVVRTETDLLEQKIRREREREAAEHNRREQRFE
ncbi:hypothetical protein PQQ51_34090, partial [Paraburkholderia xenovorans]|uniref:hypothetical protein n=1 Tax=Paraburkholderia xenovorans TaxID=36873 RepID=UPI0038B9A4F8